MNSTIYYGARDLTRFKNHLTKQLLLPKYVEKGFENYIVKTLLTAPCAVHILQGPKGSGKTAMLNNLTLKFQKECRGCLYFDNYDFLKKSNIEDHCQLSRALLESKGIITEDGDNNNYHRCALTLPNFFRDSKTNRYKVTAFGVDEQRFVLIFDNFDCLWKYSNNTNKKSLAEYFVTTLAEGSCRLNSLTTILCTDDEFLANYLTRKNCSKIRMLKPLSIGVSNLHSFTSLDKKNVIDFFLNMEWDSRWKNILGKDFMESRGVSYNSKFEPFIETFISVGKPDFLLYCMKNGEIAENEKFFEEAALRFKHEGGRSNFYSDCK